MPQEIDERSLLTDQAGEDDDRPEITGATATVVRLRPRDPVAEAVLESLRTARARIRSIEPEARRGAPGGIHRLRTTTRRLRSELRAFRAVVDPEWIGTLEGEMKWLAGLLGAVRDLDVMTDRFRKAAAAEGLDESGALAPLFEDLLARHARASRELRAALCGERYRELLEGLRHAIDHPSPGGAAQEPCREALPPLAATAWRRLKKQARALRRHDPDEEFHAVRKLAKRARYTAEMVAPILSGSEARGARRFIRAATHVQDRLGEHQDAIVAGRELAEFLAGHGDGLCFEKAAHRLLERQADAARRSRDAFFDDWDGLDRKKARRWMMAGR